MKIRLSGIQSEIDNSINQIKKRKIKLKALESNR